MKERSLVKLGLRAREREGGGRGWRLWSPDAMLCKALFALPPAVIPLRVSLTLGNWAGKSQEHGSSGVLPPVLGCGRGACCRAEAVGWAGCAGPVLGLPESANAVSTMEKPCSWLQSWGSHAKCGKHFPVKSKLCMPNERVMF